MRGIRVQAGRPGLRGAVGGHRLGGGCILAVLVQQVGHFSIGCLWVCICPVRGGQWGVRGPPRGQFRVSI